MKQYMLINTCDREIYSPMFFDTMEEAQEAMFRDFAECMGVEVPEAIKKYMNDEWEDDSQLTETNATAYTRHYCVDWQIFDLSVI